MMTPIRPLLQHNDIRPQDLSPGCFAVLAKDDARDLLFFPEYRARGPVGLRIDLIDEGHGASATSGSTETTIMIRVWGAPRKAMQLLPEQDGYPALVDLNGPSAAALTRWICDILEYPSLKRPMEMVEGRFGSDTPGTTGFDHVIIEAHIHAGLRAHIGALSNHRRLALTQAEALRFLAS